MYDIRIVIVSSISAGLIRFCYSISLVAVVYHMIRYWSITTRIVGIIISLGIIQ